MWRQGWVAMGVLGAIVPAYAADNLDRLHLLNQSEFRTLSEDLTAGLSYKSLVPAEPLGITGFDLGVSLTATELKSSAIWNKATGSDLSTLPVPRVYVHKGLPFNVDIGASYVAIPDSNIKLVGGELRYALLEGGVAMPAVAVRGAFSKLSGVDQLGFSTRSVDLSISKGFLMFTPYAGIGRVWTDSSPNVLNLSKESYAVGKYFVGANLSLGLLNLALEADQTGDNTSYSAKVGLRW